MARGGKREGAGRKTNDESRKYKILAFVSPKEVQELIAWAKVNDRRWLLDQIFGKAPQRMEITGQDGAAIVVQLSQAAAKKYAVDGSYPAATSGNK